MNASSDPLSIATATRIDAVCDQFEAAWQAGQLVQIEDLLASMDEANRGAALAALLKVELELRQRGGEQPQASDYQSRFVHQAATVVAVFEELNRQPTTDTSVAQAQTRTLSVGHDPTTAQPLAEPQPEQIGRFAVIGKLGEGAFGTVYRACDPQLDREVAIKVPRAGTLTNQTDIERFLREAKAAATMHHPNICPVYEVGTANGRPFIVMALVPGKSLADHLRERPLPFPARQSALIIRKLALALELAHQKGIVHRDLKPANILIDDERKDVVVMDFGLARRESRDAAQLTQSGILMGTPAYMSPEQARGDTATIGPASDIYSLGVILYELLAGERPFTGSMAEVLGKILHVDPPPPSGVRSGVDAKLEAICIRAMSRQPADRFPSMRALADALSGWLKLGDSHRELAPPAEPSVEPVARPIQTIAEVKPAARLARPRLWQLFTAAASLIGLIAATVFFLQTPHGTVRIEINDPQMKVVLDQTSELKFLGDRQLKIKLKPGTHGLTITRGDFTFDTTKFELTKGGETTLKVEFLAGRIDVSQDGRTIGSVPVKSALAIGGNEPPDLKTLAARLDAIGAKYKRKADRPDGTIVEIGAAAGLTDDDLVLLQQLPELTLLNLVGSQVTEQGLERLAAMSSLENLELRVSDAGMIHVARLTTLKRLGITFYSPITDNGLVQVAKLKNLEDFNVSYNNITSAGLEHLRPLKKLRVLCLNSTQVDDDGLAVIKDLPALETLWLGGCPVTDSGLAHLEGHPSLSGLIVGNPNITDVSAARLPSLKKLNLLWMGGAGLTDASVEYLAKVKTLGNLDVRYTGITDAGLARLRQALPQCSIEPQSMAADRAVAEWVLRGGVGGDGHLLLEDGRRMQFKPGEALPPGKFQVTAIRFTFSAPDPASAQDLKQLAQLKSLQSLILERFPKYALDDAWLAEVGKLTGLRELMIKQDVGTTKITAAGLAHLRDLKQLTMLSVVGSDLDAGGLAHIATLPELDHLELNRCGLAEQALVKLTAAPKLAVLDLRDTPIPASDLAALRAAKPNLEILGVPALSNNADRAAAEWVLQRGGQVGIVVAGEQAIVQNLAELPPAEFKLTSIDLRDLPVQNSDLSRLSGLRDLVALKLERTEVTDAGLDHLRDLPNLQNLILVGLPITDAGLARLADLKLTTLGLNRTKVSDDGLAHLGGMSSLQHLWLGETKIGDAGLKHLRELNLLELGLEGTQVTDEGMKHLEGMRKLGWLFLYQTQIGDAGLAHLANHWLGLLDLRDTQVTSKGMEHLRGMQNLGVLWLSGTTIDDEGLKSVGQIASLVELHLDRMNVTNDGLKHLEGLTKLKDLGLTEAKVTNEGLAHLRELKELKSLRLHGTRVTDVGVAELKAALPNCVISTSLPAALPAADDRAAAEWALRVRGVVRILHQQSRKEIRSREELPADKFFIAELDLSNHPLNEAEFENLRQISRLERLFIRHTPITGQCLAHLHGLPNLVEIGVEDTNVDNAALEHLRHLPSLKIIRLDNTKVTGTGLAHLTGLDLEIINLAGNDIRDDDLAHLSGMKSLNAVWIGSTKVQGSGLAHLRNLKRLQHLGLGGSAVTDASAGEFAHLLALVELQLHGTNVSDAALPELKKLKQLRTLKLDGSQISDAGLTELKAALPDCQISK